MKIFECLVCNFIQQLKLVPQVKCEIVFTVCFFILFLTLLIALKSYLISVYLFKNFYNHIDYTEFNELNYIEINLENRELQLQNFFQDISLISAKLFQNICFEVNSNNKNFYLYIDLNDTNNKIFENNNNILDDKNSGNRIYYFNKTSENNKTIEITLSYLIDILFYPIYNQSNIFHNNIYNKYNLENNIIFAFFDNEFIYYYPGDNNIKNSYNFSEIKNYIKEQIYKNIKNIASFTEIFPNNVNEFNNIFYLPVFNEYDENFPFSYNNDSKPNIISFTFVLNDTFTIDHFYDNISYVVFHIGKTSLTDIIYYDVMKRTSGLTILKSDYLYPYKLKNKLFCQLVQNLGNQNILFQNLSLDNYNNYSYVDNCFNENKINKSKYYKTYKDITFLEEFFINFNLFNRLKITNETSTDNHLETDLTKKINEIEDNIIKKNVTNYNQTINKIISINNKYYKVKKSYSPKNALALLEYYYPITTLSINFLIKNEGFSKYIIKDIKISFYSNIINILIPHFLIIIIFMFVISIILSKFSKQLNNPVQKLNDPSFITGQINEEQNLKKYSKNKETNIDEFKELIRIINEMVKGDIDLKQVHTKKEEIGYKLDMEKFNKEFEKNKIYNIIVKKDEIENILEEGNFSSEIIKYDIENIKKDKFVKKSLLFNKATEIKENLENESDEEKKKKVKNIKHEKKKKKNIVNSERKIKTEKINKLFKNDNTLQNRNSLIYYYFKKEYFPSWYSHHHFEEEKEEKKIDFKKEITMQNLLLEKNENSDNDIIHNDFFTQEKKNDDKNINNKFNESEEEEKEVYEEIDTSKKNLPNNFFNE